MSNKRIRKMYEEISNIESIESFYNIENRGLNIKLYKINEYDIQFDIIFTRMPLKDLLQEKISKYPLINVGKFAEEKINISLLVKYTLEHPFKSPHWILLNYSDNISNDNISEYYHYVIDSHNEIHDKQWSPVIVLKDDFLALLVKILNGIEYTISSIQ